MALTTRQLNRETLERQLLTRRAPLSVGDAVHRVVALQAQEPASPYIALWNRVEDLDAAELDGSFSRHEVVKATLMRITLHAVHADDYPDFHRAMQGTLRAARLHDRRFRQTGLTPDEADGLIPPLAEFAAEARTKDEIEEMLVGRIDASAASWAWWALRQVGPFWHAPSDAPWSFGRRPTYLAARARGEDSGLDPVQGLIRRYLEGFGPASAQDFAQFALLRQSTVRPALEAMTDLARLEGPNGKTLFDVPDRELVDEETPAPPRLMAMWDSTLLAYEDRNRILPEEYRGNVIRRNGDVLPCVLADGYVCGVWRPLEQGIEVSAFRRLTDEIWGSLANEARDLMAFVEGREPNVYSRYGRWWAELPAAEVRVLGR